MNEPTRTAELIPALSPPRLRLIAQSYLVLIANVTNMLDERIRREHPGHDVRTPTGASCARAPT